MKNEKEIKTVQGEWMGKASEKEIKKDDEESVVVQEFSCSFN